MGITRRDFLIGTAGFIVACGAGFVGWEALSKGSSQGSSLSVTGSASTAQSQDVGPRLAAGISVVPEGLGAVAYYNEQVLFNVNESGRTLLEAADGTRTFEQIAQYSGLGSDGVSDIVSFFCTLSDAGFLEHPFEVSLVEARY